MDKGRYRIDRQNEINGTLLNLYIVLKVILSRFIAVFPASTGPTARLETLVGIDSSLSAA